VRYRHALAGESAGRTGIQDWGFAGPAPPQRREPPLPVFRDERLRKVEAILLLSREPLSSRRLSQYANLADATEARTLVRHLNEVLDASGRSFRVEEVAGGFQLLTRPKFATWLRRLATVPKELRLSAPALETLSVIAYRQPAGRAEIEAVRGVHCGEIVRQLLERDLVRIAGRSDELGRPYLYATTRRFLQLFGLRSLDDLPRAEQLRKTLSAQNSINQLSDTTNIQIPTDSPDRNEEDFEVTDTIRAELSPEELRKTRPGGVPGALPRASDDEEIDDDEIDDEDEDEDDFDDLDDEEEDFDVVDEDDDEEFDEVDDEEGFEDEEWEEVDDEDDDLDDDDEDDDWDDDEDDDEEDDDESASSW
jgi:segregation and condensation protein B